MEIISIIVAGVALALSALALAATAIAVRSLRPAYDKRFDDISKKLAAAPRGGKKFDEYNKKIAAIQLSVAEHAEWISENRGPSPSEPMWAARVRSIVGTEFGRLEKQLKELNTTVSAMQRRLEQDRGGTFGDAGQQQSMDQKSRPQASQPPGSRPAKVQILNDPIGGGQTGT